MKPEWIEDKAFRQICEFVEGQNAPDDMVGLTFSEPETHSEIDAEDELLVIIATALCKPAPTKPEHTQCDIVVSRLEYQSVTDVASFCNHVLAPKMRAARDHIESRLAADKAEPKLVSADVYGR